MSRLIIISNRLPVTIDKSDGELHYHPSAGGLATGLNSLDDTTDRRWIGWPGQAIDNRAEQAAIEEDLREDGLVPVFLTNEQINLYYEGFSNKVIWPHFHYFTQYTTYNNEYWTAYQEVNVQFAEAAARVIQPGDLVWVHDYQLMLLPALIRERFPEVSIGFFLHIPFPSYEIFRMLPWRKEILQGVLGSDQIGFHTFGYMRHFLSAAYRINGFEHNFGRLNVGGRLVDVDVFPMGIDYEKYAHPPAAATDDDTIDAIKHLGDNRKLVVSIDRLDYTKGIPQRINSFRCFLQQHPEYKKRVSLIMIVVPSRANVDQYQELHQEVNTLTGEINSEYGDFDWVPVRYFYRSLDFTALTTLYKVADIALITPLRDGMNLVAKEYIAAKEDTKDGVLILSEMAGASNELNDALIVNPQDQNDVVRALYEALTMPEAQKRHRMGKMQRQLKEHNVRKWAETFVKQQKSLMSDQQQRQTKRLNEQRIEQLVIDYRRAERRLLVLDYDGTLMDFNKDPQAVIPDEALKSLVAALAEDPANRVVLNSGRDRETLGRWLGHLDVDMATEHGVWIRQNKEWRVAPGLADDWKPKVREVLENLVERTPGSFVEEKDYSLAWHYRSIDRELGEKRVREFRDVLRYLTGSLDLQVLEGNKVVEIKNAGVNKGKAMANWLTDQHYGFALAIGDDHTDEDTFAAMPSDAYTIKVGGDNTSAEWQIKGVKEVRQLLEQLAAVSAQTAG